MLSKLNAFFIKNNLFFVFCLSTVLLFSLFLIFWWNDSAHLHSNGDGEFFSWHAKALLKWSKPFDIFALTPLQGMGSTFLPYSPWWNPAAYVLSLPFTTATTHLISYAVYWVEAFVSIFFLARAVGLTKIESILVSQTFVVVFFRPFNAFFSSLPIMNETPIFIQLIAVSSLMTALYTKLGEERWLYNVVLIFFLLFCGFILFMSAPFHAPIYAAVYGLMCVGLTFQHFNRQSIFWKTTAIVLAVILLWVFNIPEYYKVVGDYSIRLNATDMFIKFSWPSTWPTYDACDRLLAGMNFLSVLCPNQNKISYIYLFAFIGGIVGLLWRFGKYRLISLVFFFVLLLPDILMFCFKNSIIQGKVADINPFYYAVSMQPFIIIFFILAISFLWECFTKSWDKLFSSYRVERSQNPLNVRRMTFFNIKAINVFIIMIVPIFTSFYCWYHSGTLRKEKKITASIEYLRNHISVKPGDSFRGYALSYFVGADSPLRRRLDIYNYEIHKMSSNTKYAQYLYARLYLNDRQDHGNTHMFSDLWEYDIPTLEEYAQMITIPAHTFYQNLLSFSEQKETSGHCLYVYDIDVRVLRALGARFIVTDSILSQAGVVKILEQQPKNTPKNINITVAEESKKTYEDLINSDEFKKLFNNEENIPQIKTDVFISEFRKRLDQISDPVLAPDKANVCNALASLLAVVKKGKGNLSLEDLKALKAPFYGHLSYYATSPSLYLYEIENPNLATFSPTQPIYLTLASEMFDLMKRPDFSFEKSIIVQDKNMPNNLVAAKNTQMRFKPNEVVVTAESEGWSILLLPVQYSHCFKIVPIAPMTSVENARLIRANLIQSALLFQGKINVSLNFDFNLSCRSEDVAFWKSAQGPVANKKN